MGRSLLRLLSVVMLAGAAACGSGGGSGGTTPAASARSASTAASGGDVVLVTHDSFAASKEVLADFTAQTGSKVRILASGDAGEAVNKSILAKGKPLGDVFFGVDSTFLTRALDAGIFAKYRPAAFDTVDPRFTAGLDERVTPVDYGDVCVNYDKAARLPVPRTLEDLTRPAYKGKLVVENPATSSPGLAFLLATVAEYGDAWPDYWKRLRANNVRAVAGWEDAYYGQFSGGAGGKGDRPLVVSYGSSPAAEVVFAEKKPTSAPTGVVAATCYRQVEYAAVLAGARNAAGARRLVDFLLTQRFQRDVPLQMFVYPVVQDTPLPPEFTSFAVVPATSHELAPDVVAAHRDAWIKTWTDTVLR